MQWQTLLVPYDFSASAEHAADLACREAKVHGARVVLLHVVELLPHFGHETTMMTPAGTTTPVSVLRYHVEGAATQLHERAAQLGGAHGVEVEVAVRNGPPVDEILAYVGERPVDVVVMGTHGRTGLQRLLVGSVAERVVRASPVPVLTIRHPDAPRA